MTDAVPTPLRILGALDAVSCEGDFCDITVGSDGVAAAVAARPNEE